MGWQNAPPLNKLTASQQGGNRGAQLWGVDYKGILYTIYQKTPGGQWSNWQGPDWAGPDHPKQVYELAAAQRHDGCVQLWVLDMKRQLWTTWQKSPGGDWLKWQTFNPGPGNIRFKKIAASQLSPTSGQPARFWGISEEGILVGSHEIPPAGNWAPWLDWAPTPEKSQWIEVTACKQGDNKGAVWAIDTKRQLWGMGQASAGGNWGPWSGPNWLNSQKVSNIAAVEQGGQKGACIWCLTDDYKVVYKYQTSPGSNNWSVWTSGDTMNAMEAYEVTAAGQNNGCAEVWVISTKDVLHSQVVKPDTKDWERGWTPIPA